MGGFETGRDSEPEKDKNLTEAVSYIYEDVKDIFSKDIKETKEKQGLMSSNFSNNNDSDDNDDSPPTILENVTNAAKAFMGFFGQANPLLGAAAGITATISGSSVADQLEKVRKIDTPFDYNKVYNQYLETPKTGLVTIPSRAKTAAAFKGSFSGESMFVPTTLGSFTPPPSTPTGYGADTDETMFVPTPTGEPYPLNRPIPRPLGMGAKIEAQEDAKQALLDQISIGEGSRSYDTVYGNKTYVQPSKAISGMTLRELFDYQELLRVATKGKVGQGSNIGTSAVGRYQVTKTNLFGKNGTPENPKKTSVAYKLGLNEKSFYNQETQEKIGRALLDKRGYKDFMLGKIDKVEFQKRLSKEFASLADPATGKSYYDKFKQPVGTTTKKISPLLDYLKSFSTTPVSNSPYPVKKPDSMKDIFKSPYPVKRPDIMADLFKSPYPVKRPTIDTTTQTSEVTTDNDDNDNNQDGDTFDLRSVPIETLLDPSTYIHGTNDREQKIRILREVYGIFVEVV